MPLRDTPLHGDSVVRRRVGGAAMRATAASTIEPMPESPLTLSTEQSDGVALIRVCGDLDLSTVGDFDPSSNGRSR